MNFLRKPNVWHNPSEVKLHDALSQIAGFFELQFLVNVWIGYYEFLHANSHQQKVEIEVLVFDGCCSAYFLIHAQIRVNSLEVLRRNQ